MIIAPSGKVPVNSHHVLPSVKLIKKHKGLASAICVYAYPSLNSKDFFFV